MSDDKTPNISIIAMGKAQNPIVEILKDIEGINLNIICSNLLDFELESVEGNPIRIFPWELVSILMQTANDIDTAFPVPAKIKQDLNFNGNFEVTEDQAKILYNINQIESVSKNLINAYDILEGQIGKDNIHIFPLAETNPNLLAIKQKKWSPLRYYQETGQLMFDISKLNEDLKKRKSSKNLEIYGLDKLENIKVNDNIKNIIENSNLIIFSASDLVSFEIFLRAKQIVGQIRKIAPLNKSVVIWDPNFMNNQTERDKEISKILGFDDIEKIDRQLADLSDYVLLNKDATEEEVKRLFDADVKVIKEQIPSTFEEVSEMKDSFDGLKESIFTIANISQNFVKEKSEPIVSSEPKTTISIDEIREELEEIHEIEPKTTNGQKKKEIQEEKEEPIDKETKQKEMKSEVDEKVPKEETKQEKEIVKEEKEEYQPSDDLSFEEAVQMALYDIIHHRNEKAQSWLQNLCEKDSDQEVVIATILVNKIIETENLDRKRDLISVLNLLYLNYKQSYEQIFTQKLLVAIKNLEEDYLQKIVVTFQWLKDQNIELCEKIIKNILQPISTPHEDNPVITEIGKVILLQLVFGSKRLSRIAISGLLHILDVRGDPSPEVWNILTAFNAAMVGIELIINFSIERAEELIRRSALLRYTGSFITTINKIMVYWKEGNNNAIATMTGSVLPPPMVRKLERIDLARKIKKLRVVPLRTLAETLNIDPKKLEVMIAELVMKDDLDIKMEVLDNRMVIVYNGPENNGEN